jgi:hypothetical protein
MTFYKRGFLKLQGCKIKRKKLLNYEKSGFVLGKGTGEKTVKGLGICVVTKISKIEKRISEVLDFGRNFKQSIKEPRSNEVLNIFLNGR